jgi:DNA-binding NtrC family response regulator
MPLELQVKLLRALETRTVARVGSSATIEVDVRVIAASNRDPFQAVADGKLRQDLLYRLYVLPVEIPPLRQRGDDVVLLAQAFLDECNREEGTEKVLGASAVERLRSHDWPGNVRELKNVVRRAFLLANTSVEGHDIQHVSRQERDGDPYRIGIGMSLQEAERRLVLGTLRRCQGDKRETATRLGVSLKTIYNRLNAYAKQRDPLLPEDAIRGRQTG